MAKHVADMTVEERERRRERNRRWRAAHLDKSRESSRKWAAANPEKAQKWSVLHPDKVRGMQCRWKAAHPEKVRARVCKWRAANLNSVRKYECKQTAKRRALKLGCEVSPADVPMPYDLQCPTCCATMRPDDPSTSPLKPNLDHYIALTQRGTHTRDNLWWMCHRCNMIKGDRPLDYLLDRLCGGEDRQLPF